MSPNYLMALMCLVSSSVIISASSIGKAMYVHPRTPLSSLLYKGKQRYPSLFQRQNEDSNQFSVTSYDNELVVQNTTSASVQSTASVNQYEHANLGDSQDSGYYYPATSSNNYGAVNAEDSVYYPATSGNNNNFDTVSSPESSYYPATSSSNNNFDTGSSPESSYYPATSSNSNSYDTGSSQESIYYPATSPTTSEHEQQSTPSYLVSYESSNPTLGSESFESSNPTYGSESYDSSNNAYPTVPYDSSNNVYSSVPYDSATPAYTSYSSQSNEILPPNEPAVYDTTPSTTYYNSPVYYESSNSDSFVDDHNNQPIVDPYQELMYTSPQVTDEELMEGGSDPLVVIYTPADGYQQGPQAGGPQGGPQGFRPQAGPQGGPQGGSQGGPQGGGFQRPPSGNNGLFGVPPELEMDDDMQFGTPDDDSMMMTPADSGSGGDDAPDDDMMMDMKPKPVDPTADDNNPLNFLNMVGSDFQPGRLVNIFFGLFIMLFMIIMHGYALWILGIAFLPGTRSLNQWEVNYDQVESACSLILDAIEYWENRVD